MTQLVRDKPGIEFPTQLTKSQRYSVTMTISLVLKPNKCPGASSVNANKLVKAPLRAPPRCFKTWPSSAPPKARRLNILHLLLPRLRRVWWQPFYVINKSLSKRNCHDSFHKSTSISHNRFLLKCRESTYCDASVFVVLEKHYSLFTLCTNLERCIESIII